MICTFRLGDLCSNAEFVDAQLEQQPLVVRRFSVWAILVGEFGGQQNAMGGAIEYQAAIEDIRAVEADAPTLQRVCAGAYVVAQVGALLEEGQVLAVQGAARVDRSAHDQRVEDAVWGSEKSESCHDR